ncbi:hypothetical protein Lal_00042224 [Lupinus albus]|nr:hypothetical protein Lal_00042224 [Lupinus albus]
MEQGCIAGLKDETKNDREFGKGIEAHPAPDMSKQLEALQLAHTDEREKAGQFTHLPQSTSASPMSQLSISFFSKEQSGTTCESHIFY